MESIKTARIAQIVLYRVQLECCEKYRKEIELSYQKSKNGILPTRSSALKTPFCLRF